MSEIRKTKDDIQMSFNLGNMTKTTEYDHFTYDDPKKVPILFRNTIDEIPSTTYGTFSIFKYPAKFIPQVIAYVLKEYGKHGMKVFDPFAGYGTVGVVSRVYGYDYELWDLNPMIDIIHKTAIMNPIKVDILDLIKRMKKSEQEFMPIWSNLEYWFPEEFIPILSKVWGFAHSLEDETKYLLMIPLLKVTKFFSYGDENVHKLYKSKFSRKKIKKLLEGDWKSLFYSMLEKEIMTLLRKQWEYFKLKPQNVKYDIKFGIDTLETKLDNDVNILITSPPYLQAQEYIRSTKIELFWLGYNENYIRSLSKKEIPYRDVNRIEIFSDKYYECKDKISEDHLRILFERYFYATLSIYSNLSENIKDYMFIFVSPAKIRANPIPIDDIIVEHLSHIGWKHQVTYIDKIVSRVMFESKVNPASGIEDSRMKTEHLIVMKR